eukprot:SAG31_NODE_17626_length_663_cov_3.404255_1_plen_63_part_01
MLLNLEYAGYTNGTSRPGGGGGPIYSLFTHSYPPLGTLNRHSTMTVSVSSEPKDMSAERYFGI